MWVFFVDLQKCLDFVTFLIIYYYAIHSTVYFFNIFDIMETEKISTQMKKWILEYIILAIIAKWEVYASDIINELNNNNLLIVEWTLYPLLSRLKNDKIVSYTRVESLQWPPRKYYQLTSEWHALLHQMRSVWRNLSKAIAVIDK